MSEIHDGSHTRDKESVHSITTEVIVCFTS